MSRLFFFIQEAFRALRRNGAPGMAAIVTTVVTVVLLLLTVMVGPESYYVVDPTWPLR